MEMRTGFDWRLAGEQPSVLLGALRDLAEKNALDDTRILAEPFRLWGEGDTEVYYAPLQAINTAARVVLVGIAPGRAETRTACRAAARALVGGMSEAEALDAAKGAGSFAGPMRGHLIAMLDDIGLPAALGVSGASALFNGRRDLIHATSALRYPVFVAGGNYNGKRPALLKHPVLRAGVETALREELESIPEALVIPLGDVVDRVIDHLAGLGAVRRERCLSGFPHPSPGNGHRRRLFEANRERLRAAVADWFRR
jgi:hypothetical protein